MRQLRVVLAAALSVAVLLPVLSQAQPTTPFDHLKCYKIKDFNPVKVTYQLDLTPEQTQFLQETGCVLKNKAKWFCIDVQKTNVIVLKSSAQPPPPLLPIQGEDARDYFCYGLKCPPLAQIPLTAEDQFGSRDIEVRDKPDHLCVPAQKVGEPPKPTPTACLPPQETETPTPAPTPTQRVVTFDYTGGQQTWVVPSDVTSISADARGAQGGFAGDPVGQGGTGGRVQATLAVTPGQTLYIYVGGVGADFSGSTGGAAGFNGGGQGGNNANGIGGGGGGGASDMRIGGNGLGNRVLVAAGGGGAARSAGGNGGGLTGSDGATDVSCAIGGAGGTQVSGGTGGCTSCSASCFICGGDGALAIGGAGGDCFNGRGGGGGGGGYFGGKGGAGSSGWGGGGGGGSSLVPSGGSTTSGFQTGNGQIAISY